jgi:predicted PolB exonuclease-like 3'-5' exonuclease
MRYCITDIETVADLTAVPYLDAVKPDARLKDPAKIEADIAEKTAEREAQLALHPDTCRIVALGYHVVGGADPTCLLMKDAFEERAMLQQFADLYRDLNTRNELRLVTYYGMSFDLPVLMSRAMYLDVDFPELNIDRYSDSSHAKYDVWWKLSRKGAIKAKGLKFYAQRLGFGTLDKVNGADVAALVRDEKWSEVEAHCLSDIGLTHALANRLGMLKVS